MQNIINFFIIGAPKCGTTALATYLNEHEDIFVSDPKEPHYFATDLENYRGPKTEEEYMSIFNKVDKETAIGEASVFYLYSKEAIKNIKIYNPDAKIIIMLRNPVEMVPSLHAQLIHSADEDIISFEEAWYSSETRKRGEKVSKATRDAKILYYNEIAKYREQLENVKKNFADHQIKIILFDDFKEDAKKVYEEVLDFLNIVQDNRVNFPRINENSKPKSIFLNTLYRRLPRSLTTAYLGAKKLFGINSHLGLISKLNNLNAVTVKREPISDELKLEIIDNYRADILSLSSMINRDLSEWLR